MELLQPLDTLFNQLHSILSTLTNHQYTEPSKLLSTSTIGQHVRHIIEWFEELNNGYESGIVNYDKRKRNIKIETEINTAILLLKTLIDTINKKDKAMLLLANYSNNGFQNIMIETTYYRELVANLEHSIHHIALIRVGINEVSTIEVPDCFGVAISTVKYKNKISNSTK